MDLVVLYQDNMDPHMEEVLGILDHNKLVSVIFSNNFGGNNEFYILKVQESKKAEVINKAREHLGNLNAASINFKTLDNFKELLKQ